jgi:hypothetical protein
MSDYDSSLPVRTEAAGDVDVFISDAVTPSQKLVINADGSVNIDTVATVTAITDDVNIADGGNSITVDAVDLDIRDLVAASDSVQANLFDEAGVAYSATNPLPVEMVADQAGDEVVDYQTSAAVAAGASVNHDYSVTAAKTFLGENLWATGSGKIKVEILVDGVAKFVGFNSTSTPNIDIPFARILKGVATNVIRVTITNRDKQPQDLYSTLSGLEA